MNTAAPRSSPVPSRRHRILRWFLAGIGICGLLVVVAVVNTVTLTRDAAVLRDGLLDSAEASPRTRIQVSAGPAMLAAVRTILGFIPDVEAEAHLALRAVRRASVGVYELADKLTLANRTAVVLSVDERMRDRGWSRAVAVNNDDNLVLVYLRENAGSGRKQKICVAVCAAKEVVVVAGTVDAAPLAELIARQGGFAARW
jgi:hypothetical protein